MKTITHSINRPRSTSSIEYQVRLNKDVVYKGYEDKHIYPRGFLIVTFKGKKAEKELARYLKESVLYTVDCLGMNLNIYCGQKDIKIFKVVRKETIYYKEIQP